MWPNYSRYFFEKNALRGFNKGYDRNIQKAKYDSFRIFLQERVKLVIKGYQGVLGANHSDPSTITCIRVYNLFISRNSYLAWIK